MREAREADLIIKHSGVGSDDDYLEAAVLETAAAAPCGRRPRVAYWDVDAAATLADVARRPDHPLRACLPQFDFVFTYGGGPKVVAQFLELGAQRCFPIYNGLDPDTHFPAPTDGAFQSDLSFLGHRLPDREARVQHFFFGAARRRPGLQFLLAGEGWTQPQEANVRTCGYLAPGFHNALNASARLVLNLNREAMAQAGFSPPTRIFEAAGAGAAIVSDAWTGMGLFFEPGREILIAAGPEQLAEHLDAVSPAAARALGRRARERALAEHTYQRRAARFEQLLHAPGSRANPAVHSASLCT
ncbi:MAG: CgeB family protein [Terriglobales bacterium]